MRAWLRRWCKAAVLLPVLALLSIACAYHGWRVQRIGSEDAFFLSLDAVKLGSEYKNSDGWHGNGWLEAARLLGLLAYLVALFKAFGLLLHAQLRELVIQLMPRDLVCIGDHPALGAITLSSAANGRRALWIGGALSHPRAYAHAVARSWTAAMARQFHIARADTCIVACRDDMAGIDTTLQVARAFDGPIVALTSDTDCADALRALHVSTDLRIVPIAQPIIRSLHEQFPPFLAPRRPDQHALDILIVGRGATAEAVMADILLSSITGFLARPRITFLAAGAGAMAAEFATRYPELGASAELRFLEAADDRDGRAVLTAVQDVPLTATNAYVCLPDDRRSLAAAGALDRLARERGWPVATIFVLQHAYGDAWRAETARGAAAHRLVPFGATNDLARGLGLLERDHDAAARRLHETYRRFADTGSAQVDWRELPEDLRESNRRQAAHLLAKLASAGVAIDDWVAQRRHGAAAPPLPAFPDLEAHPELLGRLAGLEHERWLADRRLSGWRRGERDDARRLHPDLVPFEALPERSREYGVQMVRALASG